jgi:hypothetical protein
MSRISLTTSPISWAADARPAMFWSVERASAAAVRVSSVACPICWLISAIDCSSSSDMSAAERTLSEAWFDECTALAACCAVWLELVESAVAVAFIAAALSPTALSTVSTLCRNARIADSIAVRRASCSASETA